jgi:hypothetical protein
MERLIQTAKEGAECLDSYFPRRKGHRRLNHAKAWLNVHSVYYNLVRRRASLEATHANQPENRNTQRFKQ